MARRLTPRRYPMLFDIGEHGLLDTLMLKDRHFPDTTLRNCQKTLAQLVDDGFLVGTKLTVSYICDQGDKPRHREKRIPTLYGLTEYCANELEKLTDERPQRVQRSTPAPHTYHHRRACVQVRLAFDAGITAASLASAEWTLESDLASNARADTPPNQRSLLFHHCGLGPATVSLQPDMACLVTLPSNKQSQTRLGIWWEVDRSTEGLKQLKNRKKLIAYQLLIEQKLFSPYWQEVDHFRICWVVESKRRIDTIRKALDGHPIGERFRFLIVADRDCGNLLTDRIWYTISGDDKERRAIYTA